MSINANILILSSDQKLAEEASLALGALAENAPRFRGCCQYERVVRSDSQPACLAGVGRIHPRSEGIDGLCAPDSIRVARHKNGGDPPSGRFCRKRQRIGCVDRCDAMRRLRLSAAPAFDRGLAAADSV